MEDSKRIPGKRSPSIGVKRLTLKEHAATVKKPDSEATIQASAKDALKKLGYIVLDTSVRGPARVMRHAKLTGASKGIGDLLISHPRWLKGVWIMIDAKAHKGKPTTEQQELIDAGRLIASSSLDEILAYVESQNRILTEIKTMCCFPGLRK